MAISDFFNHTCDIYKYVKTSESKGWGQEENLYKYETIASQTDIKCHFKTDSKNTSLSQSESENKLVISQTLVMGINENVVVGDKVINKENDREFTVEDVINVRDHHLKITLYRTSKQVSL